MTREITVHETIYGMLVTIDQTNNTFSNIT